MQEFEQEMQRLQDEVLSLGRMIEGVIVESVDMFRRRPAPTSSSLIILDHQIAKKRFAIELECITLLAARRPSDSQLRSIASTLEIVAELERIGSSIAEIAEIHCLVVGLEEPLLDLLDDIRCIAVETQNLLRGALDAFAGQDLELAWEINARGQDMRAFYDQVHQDALDFMKIRSRLMIKRARYLSQVARNLARIADRVINICEWIIFAHTGAMVENRPVSSYQEALT
jgi:phosphate transport system protein